MSNSVAKRIRISAASSIIYCPSFSGPEKKMQESWEKSPQMTTAKKCTYFIFMIGDEANFAELKLIVL